MRTPDRGLYVVAVLLSAFLLFLVQPMIAKIALPLFGGSPAVWGTCLLFFQGLLLMGYAYSHWLVRQPLRRQLALHAVLMLLPLIVLPPSIDPSSAPPPSAWPVEELLMALARAVGLPFLVLATNSTLVQHWYLVRHKREPYFLYAASNVGSLLALVAYPLVVEPLVGTTLQTWAWTGGYLAFVLAGGTCMVLAARAKSTAVESAASDEIAGEKEGVWAEVNRAWSARVLFKSMVASSLLVSVSVHISTDVAAVPLLWVIPLGLYLLTYIIAFLPGRGYPRRYLEIVAMLGITIELFGMRVGQAIGLWAVVVFSLGTLFVGCWICHADLARDRPAPRHLTTFYFYLALGGFLGGVFGNLVAPMLFDTVAEYPLTLVMLALVLAMGPDHGRKLLASLRRPIAWLVPVAMAGALALCAWQLSAGVAAGRESLWMAVPLAVLLVGLARRTAPAEFVFASGLVTVLVLSGLYSKGRLLDIDRSFFGVLRVVQEGPDRLLLHGTTAHGVQRTEPHSDVPTAYYHRHAPLPATMRTQRPDSRIGVVGLGAGAIAALGQHGQRMTYYEIDPINEPLARRWFTYLEKSPATIDMVVGDARLRLEDAIDGEFDLLLLDAFSSDSVPVHLLSEEAMRLYLRKIKPDGILLVHISNRYLDLMPLMKGIEERLGLTGLQFHFSPSAQDKLEGAVGSNAVVFSRNGGVLQPLLAEGFAPFPAELRGRVWTDDYSSILPLIKR